MKVKQKSIFSKSRSMRLGDAACEACSGENTPERAYLTSEMLGRLVEQLHASEALTDTQVLRVLGGGWEKAG